MADRTNPEPYTPAELALFRAMPDWERHESVDRWFATVNKVIADAVRQLKAQRLREDLAEARVAALTEAVVDMTSAYHHERKHARKWDVCQRPRCQNARLAIKGRGPLALRATTPPPHTEPGETT
jgi:hypothetical protein